MQILIEILCGWIVVSCTFGPLVAWAFFYPERRISLIRDRRDRLIRAYATGASANGSDREKRKIARGVAVTGKPHVGLYETVPRRR